MNNKGLVSRLAIAAILGTSFAGTSVSADTLKEALAKAYKTNPTLMAQREALKATDETVARARSGYLPSLNGSYTDVHSRQEDSRLNASGNIDNSKSQRRSLSLTARQNIFSGFSTRYADKQAQENVKAGVAQLLNTEQRVMLDGVTAYMNVLRDKSVVELNENQVKVLERNLQAAQDRFRVGEITRTDVAQSEARLEGAKSNLQSAEASYASSRATYQRIVGELPQTLENPDALPKLPASLDDAVVIATEQAPGVMIARHTERAAAYGVNRTQGSLYPSVDLSANFTRNMEPHSSFTNSAYNSQSVTLSVTVPLYQGGATYADIRRAKRVKSQRRLQILEAERTATANTFIAWDNLRAASGRIKSSQAQVRANEIALEGVRQESAVGSRTTLDVLNQEQELLNARVGLIRAQRDEFVAAYNLLASTGQLTAKSLGLSVEYYDPKKNYKAVKNKFIGG
ncbi:TolC family outer membrane protein [Temperatibacter marinus]|uniref:TolC family outer membrane protein n=1 Tax=Temperatibacter marinus TaxID=1456591 RepID=A0AA52H9K3_9PROT|nr:TolC family outer membrane protein [Temperatibacter marinus]WND01775.1 TolC family outer membrane protein [Temperatibacter marinus]